ncbi:MAG: methyltransferase domain-containing protein, partial [Candidatus Aenigmatarchaeota archaeon]
MAGKLSDKNVRKVYDAIAPGWYHVRRRSITDLSEVSGWRPGKLLDIGCGTAAYLKDLQALGFDCVGVDFSGKTLYWAARWKSHVGIDYALVQGNV